MSKNMYTDIFLARRNTGPHIPSNRSALEFQVDQGDLKLISGRPNLAQGLINRLLTRKGELTGLGHPDYGSRLYELIGEPNTQRTRLLAEHYIREALLRDRRVKEVLEVTFKEPTRSGFSRNRMEASVSILPVDEDALSFSLTMDLGG